MRNTMNLCLGLAVLSILCIGAGDGGPTTRSTDWGGISNGFQLLISTDKGSYEAQSRIILTVMLKNIGPAVNVTLATPMVYYTFDILMPDGKTKSPLTLYGAMQGKGGGSARSLHLELGQTISEIIPELSRIYDMTVPGKYTIIAHRRVVNRDDPMQVEQVTSDPLDIEITNPK